MEIELDNVIIFNAEDAYKYRTRLVLREYENILKGFIDRIDHDTKLPVARQIIFVPYDESKSKENNLSFQKKVFYIFIFVIYFSF